MAKKKAKEITNRYKCKGTPEEERQKNRKIEEKKKFLVISSVLPLFSVRLNKTKTQIMQIQ